MQITHRHREVASRTTQEQLSRSKFLSCLRRSGEQDPTHKPTLALRESEGGETVQFFGLEHNGDAIVLCDNNETN